MCFFHHALKIRVFLVLVCMSVLFSILVKNIAGHVLPAPPIPLPLTGSTGPDQMFAWGFKEKGYYVIKKAIGPDFWFLFCCRRHVGQAFFHDQTCKIILFLELEQYINYCHGHISPIFFFLNFTTYCFIFWYVVCTSTQTVHLLIRVAFQTVISDILFWSGKLNKSMYILSFYYWKVKR